MRMMVVAAAVLLLGSTAEAIGQAPQYKRTPGTVLKYRETRTDETETLQSYGGDSFMKTEQDATWSIRFLPGDTAVAWYDNLSEALIPNSGLPRVRQLTHRIGKRLVLRFAPNGQVAMMAGPKEDPESLYPDIGQEWVGRFMTLPNFPISVGSEWRATGSSEEEIDLGEKVAGGQEANYRVTGERTVNGMRVLVIEERSKGTAQGGTNSYSPYRVDVENNQTGTILFAPDAGLMLERTVNGEMRIRLKMNDGTPLSIVTTSKYNMRQSLLR